MTNLFELEKRKIELEKQLDIEEAKYRKRVDEICKELKSIHATLQCSIQGLDLTRLEIAQQCLCIRPMSTDAIQRYKYQEVWEEAIQYFIQLLIKKPEKLQKEHVWVKLYTSTPEYGSSPYGMGPAYGSIIADIGLTQKKRKSEGENWLTDEEKDAICYACHLLQNSKMYHTVAEYFRKH